LEPTGPRNARLDALQPALDCLNLKAEMTNNFLCSQVRRPNLGIELKTVGPWDRRKLVRVEISHQAFPRCHFSPFNSISISNPTDRLLPGAVQEHRKQFTVASPHDFFEILILGEVIRINVAEGCDDQRNAVLRGRLDGRTSGTMYQLPKSGSAEVEDRARQIDCRVIVEQPPRHYPKQLFCNRQFSDCGRTMEKNEFHKGSVIRHKYSDAGVIADAKDPGYRFADLG
jgi:hypothetical protein